MGRTAIGPRILRVLNRVALRQPAGSQNERPASHDQHEKNHKGGEKDQARQGDPQLQIQRLRGCVASNGAQHTQQDRRERHYETHGEQDRGHLATTLPGASSDPKRVAIRYIAELAGEAC
jgi:hypothetical protein